MGDCVQKSGYVGGKSNGTTVVHLKISSACLFCFFFHMCLYLCMNVCLTLYVWLWVWVGLCVCMHVCVFVCTCVKACLSTGASISEGLLVCVCVCVSVCVGQLWYSYISYNSGPSWHVCMCVFENNVGACEWVCVCVCVCVKLCVSRCECAWVYEFVWANVIHNSCCCITSITTSGFAASQSAASSRNCWGVISRDSSADSDLARLVYRQLPSSPETLTT